MWLHRTRLLTRQEWRVVLEAAALTPLAAVAVRLVPLPSAAAFVLTVAGCRRLRPAADAGAESPSLDRLAVLVEWIASRCRAQCLVRAVVLQAVLRRRGVRSDVVLGAAAGGPVPDRAAGGLLAHAWVEHNGLVFMGAAAVRYVPLFRLSGDGTTTTETIETPGTTGSAGRGALA